MTPQVRHVARIAGGRHWVHTHASAPLRTGVVNRVLRGSETTAAFSHPSSPKQARTIITGASPISDSIIPTLNSLTDTKKPLLTIDNINQRVRSAEYAVRGELAVLSEELRLDLKDPLKAKEWPFNEVISANIGNPQQLDQKPITFFRQVLSLLEYPALLEFEGDAKSQAAVEQLYAPDAIERAKTLLKAVGSVGAYSHSQGALEIRENVAKFIEERDGFPADPNNIFLTAGASSGVNTLLTTICASQDTGILIPIPQYPLYTATLALLGAHPVPYYLDELSGWSTSVQSIEESLLKAKKEGIDVRSICVINPGNPTGSALTRENIRGVIDLAAKHNLILMADEVYQTNIFLGEFHSFKKVLREMQSEKPSDYAHVSLVSLHSVSKGMVGECGHRGGYFELVGFTPEVIAQIYKLISIFLCPPVIGQCLVDLMVKPPKEGEPSYELYNKEHNGIYETLRTRALAIHEAFSRMKGVSCQEPGGAMYLFPTITLPKKAVQKAEEEGKKPDEYYCLRLLKATGVCVVPGSGFGQKDGEFHFRTTFLAPGTEWVGRIEKFHEEFMQEFSD